MQDENELSEEELCKIMLKYVGVRKKLLTKLEKLGKLTPQMLEEAKAILKEIPEEGKVVLYTDDMENMKKLISTSEVEMLSEYPLINGIIVFGQKKKIFRLVLNDLVKEFDIIRKVEAF
ncbi:MAG: hypothetical protein QXR44_04145 [Thermoproteota archaeon]|nr:hypothetical protein [Thermoproteota archaeon]